MRVSPEEIGEDFHIDENTEISIQKDRSEWSEDAQAHSGLGDVDQALRNIMGDVETTTNDGRTEPVDKRVFGYGNQYRDSYGDVNSVFVREGCDINLTGEDRKEG